MWLYAGLWLKASFSDFGVNGLPQDQEESCVDCVPDGLSEGNGLYEYGEPFLDTGVDGLYSVYENGYNPNGKLAVGYLNWETSKGPFKFDLNGGASGNLSQGQFATGSWTSAKIIKTQLRRGVKKIYFPSH